MNGVLNFEFYLDDDLGAVERARDTAAHVVEVEIGGPYIVAFEDSDDVHEVVLLRDGDDWKGDCWMLDAEGERTGRWRGHVYHDATRVGGAYDGPFSTYKEFHAAIFGFAAGFIGSPELQGAVVAFAGGRGSKGSTADAHWRQVVEEPAYALGAMTVGTAARRQEFLMPALDVERMASGLVCRDPENPDAYLYAWNRGDVVDIGADST